MANTSIIRSLFYASPYASFPPGINTAGITLQADGSQAPSGLSNPILVFRLRLTTSPETIGITPTSGTGTSKNTAIYQPPFPLSATEPYMIDIIWVESGTDPGRINWDDAQESAPITAAMVYLEKATFDGEHIEAYISYGASSFGLGVKVNFFQEMSGVPVNLGAETAQGNIIKFGLSQAYTSGIFYMNVQAATPTTNSKGQAGFEAPYSLGPQSALIELPQIATAINSVDYDGKNLSLSWTLETANGVVAPDESIVEILSDTAVIASNTGGASAANLLLDVQGRTNIKAKIYTSVNQFSSIPLSVDLITSIPTVSNVIANTSGGTVTADVDTTTSRPNAQAYLMDGDTQLAGPEGLTSGKVSFTFNTANRVGLSVVARGTSADGKTIGPPSNAAVLLATAPTINAAQLRTDPSDSSKWRLDCQWERLPDDASAISSYTINVKQDGTVITTTTVAETGTSTTISIAKSDVDLTKTQTLELLATGSSGGTSPTTSLPILFASPQLAAVATTADQISATWAAPSRTPALDPTLVSYNLVLAHTDGTNLYTGPATSALQGAVPLAAFSLDRSNAPQLMVNLNIGPVTLFADNSMGDKSFTTPLLTAPSLQAITVNPLDNKATLSWASLSGATSYTLRYTSGDPTTGVTTTSHTLATALSPAAQFGYTVEALGTSNSVPVTGPASPMTYLPTNVGNVQSVRFNGTTAMASWAAVPGAISYTIFVYDNASPPAQAYTGTTTATSLSFPLTAEAAKQYTVYVQALQPEGAGLCGTTQALFTPSLFVSKEPAATAVPYLYPATAMANLGTKTANPTATVLTLFLPELGAAAGALGADPIVEAPFTIEPSGVGDLPYKLTIAADPSVWTFDTNEIRSSLRTAYISFLTKVETPGQSIAGATPYGISILQSAIGRYLPQTFAELLYYNFGFTTDSSVSAASIDLRPGMVLRAAITNYNIPDGYSVPSWVKGYAGATTFDFEIGSYTANGNWRLGFNNFLSRLSANGALSVTAPATGSSYSESGSAGAVDLYFPQFIQPFYRLFVPTQITEPLSVGTNTTNTNFTLAAAASYSALQSVDNNPANSSTAYFRGRSTLEVMIKIMLNGSEQLVPIGTTLGNLLDQMGLRPFVASKVFDQLRLYRAMGSVVTNSQLSDALDAELEVRFDWEGFTSYADGNGLDALSMPLLPGDQIITQNN